MRHLENSGVDEAPAVVLLDDRAGKPLAQAALLL
jgi:hypothetical protein